MYKFVTIYNENGVSANVQEKNVQAWLDKGWSTEKPGGPLVDQYNERAEKFTTPKKK